MTLVTAVSAGIVGLGLTLVMTTMVIVTNQDSGLDRRRAAAISAAESGVDTAYAAVLSAGASPPCQITLDVKGSDTPHVVATVDYYRVDGSRIDCVDGVLSATDQAATAQIVSVADASAGSTVGAKGKRTMEAQVKLAPVFSADMSDALHAEGDLTFLNPPDIDGASAHIYSNNSIICDGANVNTVFDGSFYSQGSVLFNKKCQVRGDVWAVGDVSIQAENSAVDGYVRSSGGIVDVDAGNVVIGKLAQARTSDHPEDMITWDECWTAEGEPDPTRCQWLTSVPAPPVHPFPVIKSDPDSLAAWTAAGYTVLKETTANPGCAAGGWNTTNWVMNNYRAYSKTVLVAECSQVSIGKKDLTLVGDLAIFATKGFATTNQTNFASADSTIRNLYLVVPYDATSSPMTCASPVFSLSNKTTFSSSVSTLLYTPCNMTTQNHSNFTGQIYSGGNMNVANNFDMQFVQVPMPTGSVTLSSTTIDHYTLDVVYKREISNQ